MKYDIDDQFFFVHTKVNAKVVSVDMDIWGIFTYQVQFDTGNTITYSEHELDTLMNSGDVIKVNALLTTPDWDAPVLNNPVGVHLHRWTKYVGFTEIYNYCTICDKKE